MNKKSRLLNHKRVNAVGVAYFQVPPIHKTPSGLVEKASMQVNERQ